MIRSIKNQIFVSGLILGFALSVGGMSAKAQDYSEIRLNGWDVEASYILQTKMHYPSFAIRRDETGVSKVRVSINKAGEIIGYKLVKKSGSVFLDRASLAVIEKIQSFPALPASFAGNQLTFDAVMNYDVAYSAYEMFVKKRKTSPRVVGTSLAQSKSKPGAYMLASLELIKPD